MGLRAANQISSDLKFPVPLLCTHGCMLVFVDLYFQVHTNKYPQIKHSQAVIHKTENIKKNQIILKISSGAGGSSGLGYVVIKWKNTRSYSCSSGNWDAAVPTLSVKLERHCSCCHMEKMPSPLHRGIQITSSYLQRQWFPQEESSSVTILPGRTLFLIHLCSSLFSVFAGIFFPSPTVFCSSKIQLLCKQLLLILIHLLLRMHQFAIIAFT